MHGNVKNSAQPSESLFHSIFEIDRNVSGIGLNT